jgi:hypothetical protein
VDDAPFVAVEMIVTGAGQDQKLAFRTNVEDWVTADAEHPIRIEHTEDDQPSPYIRVRGALDALISRSVFYQLVDLAEANGAELGVWSGGSHFPLGRVEAA